MCICSPARRPSPKPRAGLSSRNPAPLPWGSPPSMAHPRRNLGRPRAAQPRALFTLCLRRPPPAHARSRRAPAHSPVCCCRPPPPARAAGASAHSTACCCRPPPPARAAGARMTLPSRAGHVQAPLSTDTDSRRADAQPWPAGWPLPRRAPGLATAAGLGEPGLPAGQAPRGLRQSPARPPLHCLAPSWSACGGQGGTKHPILAKGSQPPIGSLVPPLPSANCLYMLLRAARPGRQGPPGRPPLGRPRQTATAHPAAPP
jgi:hypothetical protein